MAEKVIKCVDCTTEFVLSEGEIAFFAAKGYQEPKRCKPCRQKRKAAMQAGHAPAPAVQVTRPWENRRRRNSFDDGDE